MDTTSMQLLKKLSSSLLSAEYPSVADVPPNLHVLRKRVELSFSALKAIQENANSALTGRDTSPVRRKKGKAVTINYCIDPRSFDSMGITVPTTDAEVRDVCIKILLQLRGMLEVCEFRAEGLCVELNGPRTISSFLENHHYRRFSNPPTPKQTGMPPQHRKTRPWSQINHKTQRFL